MIGLEREGEGKEGEMKEGKEVDRRAKEKLNE